ncbi:MAG TPA: hypothetical protein VGV64_05330 [Thermoplasmata archaeon]|nr:hypothetical protein [Thermoplasmata archaeon]
MSIRAPTVPSSPLHPVPIARSLQPAAAPFASHEFYTQIGSTLDQLNGSSTVTGDRTISEKIRLVTSLYPIGYELNALSDSGDWYQIVVADNWPGCASGFEEVIEVWDSSGASGPVTCDPTLTLAQGDLVQLVLTFDSLGEACLDLFDLTANTSNPVCQAQPDSGGSQFIVLSTSANSNGYYTGTMTEIVNLTASACPDYTHMPLVTFEFPSWVDVTAYVAWSDEWDNAVGTRCYDNFGNYVSIGASDPSSHFLDTAKGTSYGPHWVAGQNDLFLNSSVGFRFQTDPVPIVSERLNASTTTPALGQIVHLQTSSVGGKAPIRTLWEENGFITLRTGTGFNFTTNIPGNYTFVAYATDGQGDVSGASAAVVIAEPFPLSAGRVQASSGSSADVGQIVVFSSRVTGGIAWRSYVWGGLPTGCSTTNSSTLTCAPAAATASFVTLQVTDSNGSRVAATGLAFEVFPDPTVRLNASRGIADVGESALFSANESGGSGGLLFTWNELPGGCVATGREANCTILGAGAYRVSVLVTDSDRFAVLSNNVTFVAYLAMSVSVVPSRLLIDAGLPISFNGRVAGGSGSLLYVWLGLPAGCVGSNGSAPRCVPQTPGNLSIVLAATDRSGASMRSAPVAIEIAPPLLVRLSTPGSQFTVPGMVTFTPSVSGGTTLTNVSWSGLPPWCVATGTAPVPCSGLPTGTYTVTLALQDAGGSNVSASVTVIVHPAMASSTPPPARSGAVLSPGELELLAIAGLVILVAAVGATVARRRGGRPGPRTDEDAR